MKVHLKIMFELHKLRKKFGRYQMRKKIFKRKNALAILAVFLVVISMISTAVSAGLSISPIKEKLPDEGKQTIVTAHFGPTALPAILGLALLTLMQSIGQEEEKLPDEGKQTIVTAHFGPVPLHKFQNKHANL
jgi:putative copper export protein